MEHTTTCGRCARPVRYTLVASPPVTVVRDSSEVERVYVVCSDPDCNHWTFVFEQYLYNPVVK